MTDLSTYERMTRAAEFPQLARLILKHGPWPSEEALQHDRRLSDRVVRAAVAGTVSGDVAPSSDLGIISAGFVSTLAPFTAFDAVSGSATNLPVANPRLRVHTGASTAYAVSEGGAKPLTSFSLTGAKLATAKAVATIALSKEVLDEAAPMAETLLQRELRRAVSVATDVQFLSGLAQGVTPTTSTGSVLGDIEALVAAVNPTSASRLFLVVSGGTARSLALTGTTGGDRAFPSLTIRGGDLAGLTVLPSDAPATAGSPATPVQMVIDASKLAVVDDVLRLSIAEHATLEMSDTPTQDGTTPTASQVVNLWQTNMVGVRVERHFGWQKLSDDAVAMMAGGAW